MYKAVVFDLDGTLVDSPLCFKSIRKALDIPEGEYILEYLNGLEPGLRAEKNQRLEEIELDAARKAVPFPHVISLLSDLRFSQIKTGIFTRNCRVATDYVVRSLGIGVDMIITREDARPKPDPEGLERFLQHWRIARGDLLFVGDFRFDIECGKKAGVKTALFTNGEEDSSDWAPDHVVLCHFDFRRILGLR